MKRESTIFSLCVLMVMTMVTPVQAAIISGWEYAEDGMIVTGVNLSYHGDTAAYAYEAIPTTGWGPAPNIS